VLEGPISSYDEAKRISRVATEAAAYRDTALSFVHMSEERFDEGRSPLVQPVREESIDLLGFFAESTSSESPAEKITGKPEPTSNTPTR
jgi:hypothetical protein